MTCRCDTACHSPSVAQAGARPVCLNQEILLAYEEIGRHAGRDAPPINRVEALRIRGDVVVEALSEAFNALVDRHSVLRSRFRPTYGMPAAMRSLQLDALRHTGICAPGLYEQSVTSCGVVRIPTIEINRVSPGAAERLIDDLIWTERCTPFDYTTPPLIRGTLVRRSRTDFVMVIAAPLLVCDDESVEILLRELFLLYERIVEPQYGPSLPAAGQFHDFCVRQSERSLTSYFDRAAAYWRQRWETLQSCQIDLAELSYSRSDVGVPSGSIRHTLALPDAVSAGVRTCAEESAAAPFVLFLAACGLFLGEATSRQRIAVWVNCANRGDDDSEGTVGWLANRHAVEIDLSAGLPVDDLIDTCRVRLVEAQGHQELPLPLLWYRLGRRPRGSLPEVMLLWRSGSIYRGAGLQVTRLEADVRRMPLSMGLSVVVSEQDSGFTVTMMHSERRFREVDAQAALARLAALVEAMALSLPLSVGSACR